MSEYNAKNRTEQGGEKTVIGGELEILPGAKIKADEGSTVEGFGGGSYVLPAATENALGGVKAEAKTSADTVPCKIGEDGKLYVPASSSGDGHLVCIFTENDSAWECDQDVEDIADAFQNHIPVDGYVANGDENLYKVTLCHVSGSGTNMEFLSPISGCTVKWHIDTWIVELPT